MFLPSVQIKWSELQMWKCLKNVGDQTSAENMNFVFSLDSTHPVTFPRKGIITTREMGRGVDYTGAHDMAGK